MTTARLLRICRHRLRSLLRKEAVDVEVASELAFHRELLVRERVEAGVPREQAEREAACAFGNVAVLQEECRDQRRVRWIHDFFQDLSYGVRALRRRPGFTAVAVASLALGIGVNAAVVSVARATYFGALPYPAIERLVVVRTVPTARPGQLQGARWFDYAGWRERSRAFEVLGAMHGLPGDLGGSPDAPAERLDGHLVDGGVFEAFGVTPLVGRLFSAAEMDDPSPSPAPPVLISESLWNRRFGRDPAVVGRAIRLNRKPATIVGVVPATFVFPDGRTDYWLPMWRPRSPEHDTGRLYAVVGRLAAGVTIERAAADLDRILGDLARQAPESGGSWRARVIPLRTVQYGWTWTPLLTVGLSGALVLLLGCINVAGLLVARGAARRQELAMRVALGAVRGRIVRQLLTENLLLAALAGSLGLAVAWLGVRACRYIVPLPGQPPIPLVTIDAAVIFTVVVLTLVASLGIGVLPALTAGGDSLSGAFGCRAAAPDRGPRERRVRAVLVGAQVALALVLLVGAGLLLNTAIRVASRDVGFDASDLLTCEYQISGTEFLRPSGTYRGAAVYDVSPWPTAALEDVLHRIGSLPGVVSAAGISHHPLNTFFLPRMPLVGLTEPSPSTSVFPVHFLITPRLFSTMQTAMVSGREIDDTDTAASPWVAVVNESMARKFWPGGDAVGKQITLDTLPGERPRTIVGIVRDVPTRREQTTPEPVFYTSYLQQESRVRSPWGGVRGRMIFVVRTAGDRMRLVEPLRRAVAEIDPDRPLTGIATAEPGEYFWLRRTHVFAVSALAMVATLLASIGVYGIVAYTLAGRAREIAIRAALGAGAHEIVRAIGLPSLRIVGAGIAAGLAGAAGFGRVLESQLWGITATDRPTFAVASLLLVAVAALACVGPVRRALRIDPSIALRSE
jgi:putative ABC transport system permease protein